MSTPDQDTSPAWQFVPVDEFKLPPPPVGHAVRTGIVAVLRRLIPESEPPVSPVMTATQLRALSSVWLERVAPEPDGDMAAAALGSALAPWLATDQPSEPTLFLVGPPHSGYAEALRQWAATEEHRLLPSPTPEQVLAGDKSQLSATEGAALWVIPDLERWFLRHAQGLGLIRTLLAQAAAGTLGRGIIGCDSWSWAYLQHVWRDARVAALAPQAVTADNLDEILRALIQPRDGKTPPRILQADNGRPVLTPPTAAETAERSDYLTRMAAYCRGNLGVALAGWRRSLRLDPEESLAENEPIATEDPRQETIWVAPWDDLTQPNLPAGSGDDEALILHALLLHAGLPAEWLLPLLPFSTGKIAAVLNRLADAELVAHGAGRWTVTAHGYPAVRQFLSSRAYMIDRF